MPWKEQSTVQIREEFVLRALEPRVKFAALCREFGVSRKTGYKWVRRFKEVGRAGLVDQPRRPKVRLDASGDAVFEVLELREAHPRWGPKKLHAALSRCAGTEKKVPSVRTIARILERAGVVKRRTRTPRSSSPKDAPEVRASRPNDVWSIDFKGWWKTQSGERAEPLTVQDVHSRYTLMCRLLPTTSADAVQPALAELFRAHGLPRAILSDNGTPWVSPRGRAGLSRLSTWLVSLGIRLLRSRPANPQDNGIHERMHREIAADVEAKPAVDLIAQQAALDVWRHEYNHVRPNEALGQRVPADVYAPSNRRLSAVQPPNYGDGWMTRKVNHQGYIKLRGALCYVSEALIGCTIGLLDTGDSLVRARYYDVELGLLEGPPPPQNAGGPATSRPKPLFRGRFTALCRGAPRP